VRKIRRVTGLPDGGLWFEYHQWQGIIFFSKLCSPALEPVNHYSQNIQAVILPHREADSSDFHIAK
jgi:hypothetical protein